MNAPLRKAMKTPTQQPMMPIASIRIGSRHRKDLGDIEGLAASIAELELMHPIVVHPDGRLIAGYRRLKACEALGWTTVPVTLVDIDAIVRGEWAENAMRKDLSPSERWAIYEEVKKVETAAARERQATLNNAETAPGNFPEASKGEAREKAAKATGASYKSLEKIGEVIKAAEENPERYGPLVREMDATGKVDGVFKKMNMLRAREEYEARADKGPAVADNLSALIESGQKFSVILVDPPWQFETYSGKGKDRSAERHYDVQSLPDIKALRVGELAAKDSVLLLWAVWPELKGALEVIEEWGFTYKTAGFVWVKQNESGEGWHWGMGYYSRANTEVCLLATKGSPQRLDEGVHQLIVAPVGAHSAKPAEAREKIMKLFAGPYLELFAREQADGWTSWGDELKA